MRLPRSRPRLLFAAFALLLVAPPAAVDAAEGPDGDILYTASGADAQRNLYTVDLDGAGGGLLVADGQEGSWSPDGRRLAFQRGYGEVWVREADGTERFLVRGAYPAWSPDGSHIAFSGDGVSTIGVDGSGATTVVSRAALGGYDVAEVTWSPDGQFIAFSVYLGGAANASSIAVARADGSDKDAPLRYLVMAPEANTQAFAPDYSPDGSRIVYAFTAGYAHDATIHMMNADGTGQTDLGVLGDSPVWSPDGSQIAFTRRLDEGASWDIFVMDADGSEVRRVTDTAGVYELVDDWRGAAPAPPPPPPDRACTITGTAGDDVLTGTGRDDVICAGGGDDVVYAGAGNDVVYGGAGDDQLFGGHGDDRLFGGAGHDELRGNNGDDRLFGGAGRDELRGNRGDDRLVGGSGGDQLFGGAGRDELRGGGGHDVLRGERGDDVSYGDGGDDRLFGHHGDDYLHGSRGEDFHHGGRGTDTCNGAAGTDRAVHCERRLNIP